MIISQNGQTPISGTSPYCQRQTPNTEPMEFDEGIGHAVVAHPRQQHRRSRSLTEVWLDHRPMGTVNTGRTDEEVFKRRELIVSLELETLLQPKFHKKVCTQQAPGRDEIGRTTKYVLTHQNLDAHGEIVTNFVKVGQTITSEFVHVTGIS